MGNSNNITELVTGDIVCCRCRKTEWQYMGSPFYCRTCAHAVFLEDCRKFGVVMRMRSEKKLADTISGEAFMPQFKVGDSVRVIGQRICPSNGNVPIGATGKIFRIAGTEYLVKFDPKIPSGEACAGFMADSLELCHDRKFKVGDAVRVKAGSPVFKSFCAPISSPDYLHFGRRWIISELSMCNAALDSTSNGRHWVSLQYLEPWNDTEEWNGTAWVAKKTSEPKPAIVGKRYNSNFDFYESTNAAVRHAERLAAASPGEEFVVYQEKASFKVEKQSPADRLAEEMLALTDQIELTRGGKTIVRANCVSAKADGDLVTLTYKIKE